MRRAAAAFWILCVIGSASRLRAAEPDGSDAWHRQILAEIVSLRAELAEYSLEAQQRVESELQRRVDEVHRERQRLQNDEQAQREQIAEVERQLSSPDLDAADRPQIEAIRVEIAGPGLDKLRASRATLEKEEAELTETLERQSRRVQELREKARQLAAAAGRR